LEQRVIELFCMEIKKQCSFAIIAFEDINLYLKNDEERVWYSIHAFLTATANVSKFFWPNPRDGRDKSAEELRKYLNIDNTSAIYQRTLRNHFEHFDDRLEKWALSKKMPFIDSIICEIDQPLIGNIDNSESVRFYDPKKHIVYFMGKKYGLLPIYNEVRELYKKTEQKIVRGSITNCSFQGKIEIRKK
jgi:hypothetical protein